MNDYSAEYKLKYFFCGINDESVRHSLLEYSFAYNIWIKCFRWFQIYIHSVPMTNLLAHCRAWRGKKGEIVVTGL